jgi:hypothetical protein
MKFSELRRKVNGLRAEMPGLISLLVFDRERNLLLYGESDDIVSPLREISACYAKLLSRLESAHACRRTTLGKSVNCVTIASGRMAVSLRALSAKHAAIGECIGLKCLALLNHGVSRLARALEEAEK